MISAASQGGVSFTSFSQYWVDPAERGSEKPAGEAGFSYCDELSGQFAFATFTAGPA